LPKKACRREKPIRIAAKESRKSLKDKKEEGLFTRNRFQTERRGTGQEKEVRHSPVRKLSMKKAGKLRKAWGD